MLVRPTINLIPRTSNLEMEPPEDSWQLLDDFLLRLQEQSSSTQQLRAMLDTIQRVTRADLVFACSPLEHGPIEQVGVVQQSPAWCREATRRLLVLSSDLDHFLFRAEGGDKLFPDPSPSNAALVRLSKSRRVWIAAVVFNPERRMRKNDVQLIKLARRMMLQQTRQTQMFGALKETLFSLVRCLTTSLDARDPYTWGHSERVARMGVRLAQELKVPEAEIHDLYLAGLLHDIGKIGVRDEVLRKPTGLTSEERLQIERHTVIGDAILSHVTQLAHLRPAVRSHHERVDGGGYPDQLKGERIPFLARILAVADSCDAMLSDRPYRKGMPTSRIDEIIAGGAGTQWDGDVTAAFLRVHEEVYAIHQRGLGDSVFRAIEQVLKGKDCDFNAYSVTQPPSSQRPHPTSK